VQPADDGPAISPISRQGQAAAHRGQKAQDLDWR